ncbi:Cys/Met metabolism pyridoxal-phosphate-dependent protein [Pseudomonas sp. M47T1]|uniref:trans-sulfuration enzyme family protein n=1 Tax=unclassified Pseudomonas TaxID=196821 RepID=UPI0002606AFD|nr:PLP-dependent aspartate aminotransferase family protein [Pseudomonas sp. M47T1]EIK98273.1 Cys/Met metabolism pyridoxal-phosphate-dependent protein [Pseudomonas sp. M47T1]
MAKDTAPALGIRTLAVHAGQTPDPSTGAIATPISTASAYSYGDFDTGEQRFSGESPGYLYSRFANPTVAALEGKMAALEAGESAVAFASGMAAICSTLMALVSSGDELIHVGTLYGGTEGVMRTLLPRFGVHAIHVASASELQAAITDKTRLIFTETPDNPMLGIVDLAQTARIAQAHQILTVADNTFATPCLTRPLTLGIDVVVHSATKFIGGHGDATGGVVVASRALVDKIRGVGLKQFGGCLSPFEASLLIRGLKTLPLRVEAASLSAERIAWLLDEHPAVATVFYPGLPSHPGHAVARRQMSRFGALMAFELKGGKAAARTFLDSLALVTQAVSLGDTDSLACHPASTTHSAVAEDIRRQYGVTDGLVRLSVGIEDVEDLLRDIQQALDAL